MGKFCTHSNHLVLVSIFPRNIVPNQGFTIVLFSQENNVTKYLTYHNLYTNGGIILLLSNLYSQFTILIIISN